MRVRFDDHHHMLEDIGVRVMGPMPSSSQVLKSHLETFKYELVVEFLWYNLPYSAFLRELNQLVKQAFPSTAVVTVTPDLNHERFTPDQIKGEDSEAFSLRRALFRQNLLDTETFFWSRAEVNSCVNVNICKHIHELYPSQHLHLQVFYQAMSPTKGGEQTRSDRTPARDLGAPADWSSSLSRSFCCRHSLLTIALLVKVYHVVYETTFHSKTTYKYLMRRDASVTASLERETRCPVFFLFIQSTEQEGERFAGRERSAGTTATSLLVLTKSTETKAYLPVTSILQLIF